MSSFDMSMAFLQTSDGGFALTGAYDDPGGGGQDMWLVKTNSLGEIEFNITFGGSKQEFGVSMTQISDGKYAIVGVISGYSDEDLWLIIFSSESEISSTSTVVTSSGKKSSISTSATVQTTTSSTSPLTTSGLSFSTFLIAVLLLYRKRKLN